MVRAQPICIVLVWIVPSEQKPVYLRRGVMVFIEVGKQIM